MMEKEVRIIKRSANVNSPVETMTYFSDVFERTINDIIRFFSIYDNLHKSNKESFIAFDYYNLTILSIRKLIEPPDKKKVKSAKHNRKKILNRSYQLNFIQWINRFYNNFNRKNIVKYLGDNNKNDKRRTVEELKKELQELETIINDDEIKYDHPNITHPLKTRIYNYASKYVAHRVPLMSIELWEYNNIVFPTYEEIKNLVTLISRIEDKYRNLLYYWSNLVEMPKIDYSKPLEEKSKEYFKEFTKEITKQEEKEK